MGPPPLVHDLRGGRVLRFVQEPARAVFIMIGAELPTDWLPDEIRRDPRGIPDDRRRRRSVVIGSVHRYLAQLSDPGPYP